MFSDLLNKTCSVLRLSGVSDYDFSTSDEGEVDETWQTVESEISCRVDRAYTGSRRRQDGLVETGRRRMFVETGTDIQDGDRVECDGKFYQVEDSEEISGMRDDHHMEVSMMLIDWNS